MHRSVWKNNKSASLLSRTTSRSLAFFFTYPYINTHTLSYNYMNKQTNTGIIKEEGHSLSLAISVCVCVWFCFGVPALCLSS